jgi:ATP-binding cassette subfamily B protein
MPLSHPRLKKFFSYYRPYKRLVAADIFCAVAVSAVSLVFPLFVRYITGDVLSSASADTANIILYCSLVLMALIILQNACALFYDHMGHVLGARMERDMRNELFTHYQTLPFSFFDREKPGSIISRLTSDLLNLAELYHHGPEDIIIYALTFIGAFAILLRINTGLALIICAFLPFMFLYSLVYSKILHKVYTRNLQRIAEINARIDDNIGGIRTVKAFGNERLEIEKFKQTNEEYYKSRASIYKHEARYFTGMGEFFARLIVAIVVIAGAVKISNAALNISDFISFILYITYLTAPIPQIAQVTAQYQQGLSSFNRFMDVLEIPGEKNGKAGTVGTNTANGEVEFSNVSFKYADDAGYILKDISFKINTGDFVALTGPSGIGKTTLCSLIPRFYEASSGDIFIGGKSIKDMDIADLRRNIGIVQQDNYVFAGSIGENITYGKIGA